MRVLLVNMPWSPVDLPSLALGILKRAVNEKVPGAEAEVLHANLEYIDWLTATDPGFGHQDYEYYSLSSYFLGCGDWVFSSALYDDPDWRVAEFTEAMGTRIGEERLKMSLRLHAEAPRFVARIAERIVAWRPDVVGFSSTFQQNTAALAAAKYVKRLAPHVVTLMGGANCDGEQGAAAHRNFPFLDYVVRGEGEASLPALLNALREGTDISLIPGICRREDDTSVANPMSTAPLPPAAILPPDYSGYFERLASSSARSWVEPKLVVESARGCWWGEKHHCTFCGLNGSFMEFRSKSPQTFYDEIMDLVREHQVLDMYLVDNILDMGYLKSVLPRIIDSGYDLRMHVEIKANMRSEQLQTLADAGLVFVQPGIESLNDRVLDLMDKGVSGCQNVRMLRDGQTAGLSIFWNYLHGFPDERDSDYDPVIAQLPALEHLDPPIDLSARIAIERFSPYFTRPELGFSELRPALPYRVTYDLPEDELLDLAYVFDVPARGIGVQTTNRLNEALRQWQEAHLTSRLTHVDLGDRIVFANRRRAFTWRSHVIDDPRELAAFRLLAQPHTPAALTRKITVRGEGDAPDESAVRRVLDRWLDLGLVFTDAGSYVHLAPESVNDDLLRLGFMRTLEPDGSPVAEAEVRPEAVTTPAGG
ncbi:RiPP maturation radical SAM protein 1 [Streptomyces pluripotens]|uniref:RiPP maturation radical SAM protein 1 n=1 Tax=Streptomyces pluripotens TaxID=1355015 RepID=A0A221P559_9ACTN|nr:MULTISPECIES: RiPP maturation radical SAM C-methyltransferase [Streptomyces]ARP73096.1 RiPP maturation radical SAM protein 1 [Streptomyces pluripotens]ASN27347.1 RiPP maturation radical SAM protein 1 [Streptomyces pluripotens]MCH0560946.1 RiPP maturation radical SAM C-methyltransferase [Streptomyces sp. MUM 16J]